MKYHGDLKDRQTNIVAELEWEKLCLRALEVPSVLTPMLLQRAADSETNCP
jgi:hypothetical protein